MASSGLNSGRSKAACKSGISVVPNARAHAFGIKKGNAVFSVIICSAGGETEVQVCSRVAKPFHTQSSLTLHCMPRKTLVVSASQGRRVA